MRGGPWWNQTTDQCCGGGAVIRAIFEANADKVHEYGSQGWREIHITTKGEDGRRFFRAIPPDSTALFEFAPELLSREFDITTFNDREAENVEDVVRKLREIGGYETEHTE